MTSPCVGCGYCCIKVPCPLSVKLYGKDDCPALQWDGERYRCTLAEEYHAALYIGAGCCAALNSWRWDVQNRDNLRSEPGWKYGWLYRESDDEASVAG